jgi:hypothetical protein
LFSKKYCHLFLGVFPSARYGSQHTKWNDLQGFPKFQKFVEKSRADIAPGYGFPTMRKHMGQAEKS